MRGVAYEAPHLRLALLAGLKERLNLGEHGVQRDGEVTDLVVRVVVLDALGEVAGGNLGGGLFNARERLEGTRHNHPRHGDGRG